MKLRSRTREQGEENLVSLINIVFLILIFFLVASTIRPFTQRDVNLAETAEASGAAVVPRMLVLTRDGDRIVNGTQIDDTALTAQAAQWASGDEPSVTIVADAELEGTRLIEAVSIMTAAGVKDIKLLTRRSR